MQFRAEFFPQPFRSKISYRDAIMLIGSCFTEEMGNKLAGMKFRTSQNPAGILFNPLSISRTLINCVMNAGVQEDDLFYHNELWHSWHFHSRFSHPEKMEAVRQMNASLESAHAFLKNAGWLLMTLGSAFVYETGPDRAGGEFMPVANCHKVPADSFRRRLLSQTEIILALQQAMDAVKKINPDIRFIVTISPVRHLREGFIDNNRSKAALIQAVHELTDSDAVFYFPSYELVIDDLRDYRFYAEDLAHPNYAATNYVWEKFTSCCMDDETLGILKEMEPVQIARKHKPFNPASEAHRRFMDSYREKVTRLQAKYPFLDLAEEAAYFSL